jgi:hypothetical protein
MHVLAEYVPPLPSEVPLTLTMHGALSDDTSNVIHGGGATHRLLSVSHDDGVSGFDGAKRDAHCGDVEHCRCVVYAVRSHTSGKSMPHTHSLLPVKHRYGAGFAHAPSQKKPGFAFEHPLSGV